MDFSGCVQQTRITNTVGTTIRFPYGDIITFRSKRHLFRGENQDFGTSMPSLNRKLANLPKGDVTLSDISYKALAQHYGFETHLLDLTNDFRTALFFETCAYMP